MKNAPFRVFCVAMPALLVLAGGTRFNRLVSAQNQEMQERVAEIKQAAAQNKQALAQYTWVEQVTISPKSGCSGSRTSSFSKHRKTSSLQMGEKIEFP